MAQPVLGTKNVVHASSLASWNDSPSPAPKLAAQLFAHGSPVWVEAVHEGVESSVVAGLEQVAELMDHDVLKAVARVVDKGGVNRDGAGFHVARPPARPHGTEAYIRGVNTHQVLVMGEKCRYLVGKPLAQPSLGDVFAMGDGAFGVVEVARRDRKDKKALPKPHRLTPNRGHLLEEQRVFLAPQPDALRLAPELRHGFLPSLLPLTCPRNPRGTGTHESLDLCKRNMGGGAHMYRAVSPNAQV